MMKIISKVDPFLYTQKVAIYNDDKLVRFAEIDTPRLAQDLVSLAYQHNVTEIDLSGSKLFLNKFVKDIEKEEIKNYDVSNLIVRIV